MNVQGRLQHEVWRYNLFKWGVLLLLAIAVGVTQWGSDGLTQPVRAIVPTPLSSPAPTETIITPPTLLLDSHAPLIVNSSLTLRGSGTPDHVISLFQSGLEHGKAVVDAAGNWSFTVALTATGQFQWTAVAIDGAGRISAESEPLLVEVRPIPNMPTLAMPVLPANFFGGDVLLTGSADAGSVVGILLNDRIFDVATADENATWSYDLPLDEVGKYKIAAQLIDAAIEEQLTSDSIEIEVSEVK